MPRSQDPHRPTGAHWGAYDSVEELPNVKGSEVQTSELSRGDVAFVEVGEMLYVCASPAEGRALWRPLILPLPKLEEEVVTFVKPRPALVELERERKVPRRRRKPVVVPHVDGDE